MLFILLKIEWLALRVLAKQCPQSSRFTIQIALDLIIITIATALPCDDQLLKTQRWQNPLNRLNTKNRPLVCFLDFQLSKEII